MRRGYVEIRMDDHIIKAAIENLTIEYNLNTMANIYQIKAIETDLDIYWQNTNLISRKEKTMADLQTTIRTADLDETTKMLRERGVEDATGARTTLGTNILVDLLYKQNRQAIADLVKAATPELKPVVEGEDVD